jgi:hypothetical protein
MRPDSFQRRGRCYDAVHQLLGTLRLLPATAYRYVTFHHRGGPALVVSLRDDRAGNGRETSQHPVIKTVFDFSNALQVPVRYACSGWRLFPKNLFSLLKCF